MLAGDTSGKKLLEMPEPAVKAHTYAAKDSHQPIFLLRHSCNGSTPNLVFLTHVKTCRIGGLQLRKSQLSLRPFSQAGGGGGDYKAERRQVIVDASWNWNHELLSSLERKIDVKT